MPLLDGHAKAAMEQQVFGRIARQRELRQHQQVGVELAAGALGRGDDALRIARDVADEQVELPEGDAQFVRSWSPWRRRYLRAPRLGSAFFFAAGFFAGLALRAGFAGFAFAFLRRALLDDQHGRAAAAS